MPSPAVVPSLARLLEQVAAAQSTIATERRARLLILPDRLEDWELGPGIAQASRSERPDAIVLTQPNVAHLIANRLPPGPAAILPVIDASGSERCPCADKSRRADLHIARPSRHEIADALTALAPVIERVHSLPSSVLYSDDARVILLARLMTRDRGMEPRRDANAPGTVAYDDETAIAGALRHAEELVALGFLQPHFFDMLTTCPRCDAGRLCARERCPACGSTHLVEEPIFHHLRCAFQAPEHEFRRDGGYVCPKCRVPLLHFSVDYDRPGSVSVCRACGHTSTESSVGFLCLDCGADCDAAETATREIHRYEPTKQAYEWLKNASPLPTVSGKFNGAVHRVRNFVSRQVAAGEPFCILAVEMAPPSGNSPGRSYQMTWSLLASLMRETFTPETEIIDLAPRFLALLENDKKAEVEEALPEIRTALERFLSTPAAITYRVYGPAEIDLIFGNAEPSG